METCVFRIIQEALTNVFRHSKTQKASVKIGLQGKDMSIVVSDDGIGITQQVSLLESGSIGMGIGGMRQRIREFNGKLTISPLGETGTALEVTIPHAVSAPIEPGLSVQANR